MLHPRSRGTVEFIVPAGDYTNNVRAFICFSYCLGCCLEDQVRWQGHGAHHGPSSSSFECIHNF
jgi:hypothetical protein